MAIVMCPECSGWVSDHADACPHCGYVLPNAAHKIPKSTQLGPARKSWLAGGSMAVLSLAVGALGLIFLCAIPVVGVLLLLGALFLLIKGNSTMVGVHTIRCPHCGNSDKIDSTVTSYCCPKCRQKCVKRGNYMIPVKQRPPFDRF